MLTGRGKYRLNPNLYKDGKVCLSLLGTWTGPGWQIGTSTLLRVLISIQSLILGVPDPYYNEPGYEVDKGTPAGDLKSKSYNETCRKQTLEVAILYYLQNIPNTIYPEFSNVIKTHMKMKRHLIDPLFEKHKEPDDDKVLTEMRKNISMIDSGGYKSSCDTIPNSNSSLYVKYHIAWMKFIKEEKEEEEASRNN